MKRISCLIAAALLAGAAPAAAAQLTRDDASYLTSAMQTQLGRYALASVAQQHGSGSVKSLAQTILTQASSNLRTLNALAKQYSVPAAKGPDLRDSYHYGELRNLKGADLNRQFVLDLRIDDEMRLSAAKQEMNAGKNAQLRAFAKRGYGAMQHELDTLSHMK